MGNILTCECQGLGRLHLRAVSTVKIGAVGRVVWLEGYGLVRVFKIVATDGDSEL